MVAKGIIKVHATHLSEHTGYGNFEGAWIYLPASSRKDQA